MTIVTPKEFSQRRQQFIEKLRKQHSIAIIPSAQEFTRTGDSHFPYRQDNDFYYLTGFNEPEAIAVLIPDHPEGEYWLFNRPKDPTMELWTGKRTGQEQAKTLFGANQAHPITKFYELLPTLLQNREVLYFAFGRHPHIEPQITETLNQVRRKIRAGISAPQTIVNPEVLLHEMRLIKSAAEIATMKKAGEISVQGHIAAMRACRSAKYEYELQAALEYEFLRHGSPTVAYSSIVGAGENSCILHYHENNAAINKNDIVLIDAGCEYECYASDITRSFPASGKFSAEQRAIYEIVLKSQLDAIKELKPGLSWEVTQNTVARVITEGLVDIGLLKGNVSDLVEQKAYFAFYMHQAGHWLGLDTHDVGSYKPNDQWRTLRAGMVRTVEPGIYIAPNTPNVPERWWNIGIRIEDDVLITENGCDVYTGALPKNIDDVEALMR